MRDNFRTFHTVQPVLPICHYMLMSAIGLQFFTKYETHWFQVHEYIAKCNNEKKQNDDVDNDDVDNDDNHDDANDGTDYDSDVDSDVDEDDEVIFPTARKIHEEIQKINGIPKWNFTTSYRILLALGFRYKNSNLWKQLF